jgi:hypothetical protein
MPSRILAAAEFHLFAVGGEILLDLDEKLGVGQPHPVAGGRAEHLRIGGTGDCRHQQLLPKFRPVGLVFHIPAILWSRNDPMSGSF